MTFIQELSAMKNLMILNIGLIKNLNDQQNQYSKRGNKNTLTLCFCPMFSHAGCILAIN